MGSKALFRVSLLMRWSRRTFISILVWDSVQTCRPSKNVFSSCYLDGWGLQSVSEQICFVHTREMSAKSQRTHLGCHSVHRFSAKLVTNTSRQGWHVSGFNLWLSYLKRFKIVFVITTCSRLYLALDATDTTLPGYSRCEWRGICSQRCVWQQNDGFNKHSKLYLFALSCWFSEMFYQIWPHDPSCYPEVQ